MLLLQERDVDPKVEKLPQLYCQQTAKDCFLLFIFTFANWQQNYTGTKCSKQVWRYTIRSNLFWDRVRFWYVYDRVRITLIQSTKYSKQQMTIKLNDRKKPLLSLSLWPILLKVYFTWQTTLQYLPHRTVCVYVVFMLGSLPLPSYVRMLNETNTTHETSWLRLTLVWWISVYCWHFILKCFGACVNTYKKKLMAWKKSVHVIFRL